MFIPFTFAHPFASPPPLWSAARQIEFDVALQTRRGRQDGRWCMAPHSHDGSHPKRTSIAMMLLRVLPLPRCMSVWQAKDDLTRTPWFQWWKTEIAHIIDKIRIARGKSSSIILLKLPCIDNSPRVHDCHTSGSPCLIPVSPLCCSYSSCHIALCNRFFWGVGRPSTTECEKDILYPLFQNHRKIHPIWPWLVLRNLPNVGTSSTFFVDPSDATSIYFVATVQVFWNASSSKKKSFARFNDVLVLQLRVVGNLHRVVLQ